MNETTKRFAAIADLRNALRLTLKTIGDWAQARPTPRFDALADHWREVMRFIPDVPPTASAACGHVLALFGAALGADDASHVELLRQLVLAASDAIHDLTALLACGAKASDSACPGKPAVPDDGDTPDDLSKVHPTWLGRHGLRTLPAGLSFEPLADARLVSAEEAIDRLCAYGTRAQRLGTLTAAEVARIYRAASKMGALAISSSIALDRHKGQSLAR